MTNEPPKPGQCCQTCGLVVPGLPKRLTAGKKHPENAHDAAAAATISLRKRSREAMEILEAKAEHGATDDEIDAVTGWSHQCTTPVMHALRRSRLVAWAFTPEGLPKRRPTRKGNAANVNVLAKYATNAQAAPPEPTP